MPLELGLALYRSYKFPDKHRVYIFEEENYRIQKSTSDLNAFDVQLHNGTPKGVMAQLRNTFIRESSENTVPEMLEVLKDLKKVLPKLKENAGVKSIFDGPAIANGIILAASTLVNQHRPNS